MSNIITDIEQLDSINGVYTYMNSMKKQVCTNIG